MEINIIEGENSENSISDIEMSRNINVFPNPNNGFFTVAYYGSTNEYFTFSILDILGKQIGKTKYIKGGSSTDIQLQETKGIYFVVVKNSKNIIVEKQRIAVD